MNQLATNPVTMVYHELRAPLGLVATAARSAAADCEDDYLRSRCQVIVRAAERMLRTASNVFALAQAGANEALEDFDPVQLIVNVVADLRALGMDARLTLRGEGTVRARGASQFEALIQSLITNAYDHRQVDTPICVSFDVTAAEAIVCVRNAIDPTSRHRGLGVGLFIGQQLAETIGATIEAVPENDQFCTRLRIPVCRP